MKRRSFLKSAASAFPIVLAEPFAVAAQPSDSPQKEIRPVLSGEDRFGKNWSRGYSRILFKNSTQETSGNFFVIEHDNLISGGPPVHSHLEQEEWFYVMEGEVQFQIGEKRLRLKAGDSILGPRRIPHAFSAVGAKPAKMLIAFSPAGKMEQFFRDTAVPNPPVQDAAFFRRYEMELVGPPLQT
jgi:quercetin dioxygenase-like cupin family protein